MGGAMRVFEEAIGDKMKTKQSINTILNALFENGQNEECVHLFHAHFEKIREDPKSHLVCLRACSQGTLVHFGQDIHRKLSRQLLSEQSIQIALIEMFGKFGMMDVCDELFGECEDQQIGI